MKTIKLDATNWKSVLDFYDALLPALGAPKFHGRNINALMDSMVWGEINDLEPPYTVEIHSTKNIHSDIKQHLIQVKELVAEQKKQYDETIGRRDDVYFNIFE